MSIELHTNETQESQKPVIKEVKKMGDGSINFPYSMENAGGRVIDHNFRIYKDKSGKLMVENRTKVTPDNKGYIKNIEKKFELRGGSSDEFLQDLGKALDAYVGKEGRKSATEKGGNAYELIKFGKILEDEHKEKESTLAEANNLKQMIVKEVGDHPNKEIYIDGNKFTRNKTDRSLRYEYTLQDGNGDHAIRATFKETNEGVVVTLDAFYVRAFGDGGDGDVDEKFTVKNINDIPNEITKKFTSGIQFKTYAGLKRNVKSTSESWLNKSSQKSENAVKAFKYCSKEK